MASILASILDCSARSYVLKSEAAFFLKRPMLNFNPYLHREYEGMTKKILIVEDDFDTRYVISMILKN